MIGQEEVLEQVNNLIQKGFPRFIIITGIRGQGKTTLALYISKQLKIPIVNIGIKVDEIRDMIEMAYKQTEPIIYLIQNADKMSIGAKNSLLKIIEETPNNAYFIILKVERSNETMAKLTAEEFAKKYSEKIVDNDDLLVELMEDSKDSILDMSEEAVAEIEALKAEVEKLRADYADLKERYKMRFLEGADVVEEVEEEKAEEEPKEEEIIDIKEI